MSVLIIYANPKNVGHCSTMLKSVTNYLDSEKQKYRVLDLYKLKFNPVLEHDELVSSKKNKDVLEFQKKIKNYDKLVFIYPIWWNNMPAILKGFMDRVFTAKFAFIYKKKFRFGVPVGLLKGKKAAIFITSGSPRFLFRFFLRSRGKYVMTKDILDFCAIKNKTFHYGKAVNLNEEAKLKIEKLINKGIRWLLK